MKFADFKRALTRKVGPGKFKVPVWVLLVVGAAALYWWRKRHAAAGGAAGASTAAPAGSSALAGGTADLSGGGGGGGLQPPQDLAPFSPASTDPFQQPPAWWDTPPSWWDTGLPTPDNTPPPDATPPPTTPAPGTKIPGSPRSPSPVPLTSGSPGLGTKSLVYTPSGKAIAASDVPGGFRAVPVGSGILNVAYEVPVGATDIKRLAGGAIEYTTRTGAVIEQAPGKSRFRVSKPPASTRSSARATPAPSASHNSGAPAHTTPTSRPAPAPAPSRTSQVVRATPAPRQTVVQQQASPVKASPGVRVIE